MSKLSPVGRKSLLPCIAGWAICKSLDQKETCCPARSKQTFSLYTLPHSLSYSLIFMKCNLSSQTLRLTKYPLDFAYVHSPPPACSSPNLHVQQDTHFQTQPSTHYRPLRTAPRSSAPVGSWGVGWKLPKTIQTLYLGFFGQYDRKVDIGILFLRDVSPNPRLNFWQA